MKLRHYEIVTDADKLNVDSSSSEKFRTKLEENSKIPEKYIKPDGSFDYFAVWEDMCKPYKKKISLFFILNLEIYTNNSS